MNYHRLYLENSLVFITIITSKRRNILIENISLLKISFEKAIANYNFKIIAICVLPNHIHMIIKPYEISDYPQIIKQIKTYFSKNLDINQIPDYNPSKSHIDKQERDVWQRRYWEHTIQNEKDLFKHFDYIHYNPIKHGFATKVKDWKYSSFHEFVKNGFYDVDWCNFKDINNIAELDIE